MKTIRRPQLARACRHNDNFAENGNSLDRALPLLGFNADDASDVALQRALRMHTILKGTDAARLTTSDISRMNDSDRMRISAMASMFIDGLAASARALQEVS